jgi:hypothetical protein
MAMKKILALLLAGAFVISLVLSAVMMKMNSWLPHRLLIRIGDRAIRVDVDLQTMYAAAPRKIEKPLICTWQWLWR